MGQGISGDGSHSAEVRCDHQCQYTKYVTIGYPRKWKKWELNGVETVSCGPTWEMSTAKLLQSVWLVICLKSEDWRSRGSSPLPPFCFINLYSFIVIVEEAWLHVTLIYNQSNVGFIKSRCLWSTDHIHLEWKFTWNSTVWMLLEDPLILLSSVSVRPRLFVLPKSHDFS